MSLAKIGPVEVDFHGDPKFSWAASPTARGMRAGSISGIFTWTVAQQLSELVDNYDRRIPVGDQVGVLEDIWFVDDLLADFRGQYLLTGHNLSPQQQESLNGIVTMQLQAVLLSARLRPVAVRSDHARANDYGLAARSVLADPYYGGSIVASPGGTHITREFDPNPYDVELVSVTTASMDIYVSPTASTVALAPGGRA